MKKRKQMLAILLIIMSVLLLACSKANTIICGNCSATNPSKNQYCSNCGTAFFQNGTTSPTETTETNTTSESTEATTDNSSQNTEPPTTQPTQPEKPTQQKPSVNTHTHNYSAATCTTPKTCSCGATTGGALGHSWNNATCTTPKKCSRCSTTSGSAASHSYTTKTTAATCTAQGYTTYTCSACGDSYKDNYVNAKHNFQNYKCSSCGAIDKDHAYEYLMAWIKQNGTTSGSSTDVSFQYDNAKYALCYDATSDEIFLRKTRSMDEGWTYAAIYLDNYYYGTTIEKNGERFDVRGYIDSSSFTANSAISVTTYTGTSLNRPLIEEMARLDICSLVEWLASCLTTYNLGITIADLGFTSY